MYIYIYIEKFCRFLRIFSALVVSEFRCGACSWYNFRKVGSTVVSYGQFGSELTFEKFHLRWWCHCLVDITNSQNQLTFEFCYTCLVYRGLYRNSGCRRGSCSWQNFSKVGNKSFRMVNWEAYCLLRNVPDYTVIRRAVAHIWHFQSGIYIHHIQLLCYIYTRTCICIYTFIYTYEYICIYIYIYMYVFFCVYIYAYTRLRSIPCKVVVRVWQTLYMHIYAYTCKYIYMYICIYISTHAHNYSTRNTS